MPTLDGAFRAKLEQKIKEQVQELREQATGNIQSDIGAVNYVNGRIRGLSDILDLAEDVQSEIMNG